MRIIFYMDTIIRTEPCSQSRVRNKLFSQVAKAQIITVNKSASVLYQKHIAANRSGTKPHMFTSKHPGAQEILKVSIFE